MPHRALSKAPLVSVIVCSHNGARTLTDCLDSLGKLNYPNCEVILVDDGSTDNTAQIAAQFPNVRYIHQSNHGLSHARNTGAAAAKGEVFAYTDSDCMADPDWLYYLVGTLLSGDYAGVGGPNVSPPAQNAIQACVAAAPGGPSHVLLTDTVAEHIPGCNMAFYRWAFEQIGGFDPEYHKAGDDVDFCWRLQQSGCVIAFSPTAIVWHHRRFTLRAFLKQQEGYGEAESLLRFKHLIFFGPTGTAKWRGQIYGAPRFGWFIDRPVIYHGVFLHGACAHRTKVRHRPGALTRNVPGFSPTAGAGIFSLLHLAPFQTDAGQRHSRARTFAGRRQIGSRIATPGFLERRGTRSPPFARRDFPVARGRRLALLGRYRLERMGHPDLRKLLVEHCASDSH